MKTLTEKDIPNPLPYLHVTPLYLCRKAIQKGFKHSIDVIPQFSYDIDVNDNIVLCGGFMSQYDMQKAIVPAMSLYELQQWLLEKGIKVYVIWYNDHKTEARWSVYIDGYGFKQQYVGGDENYQKAMVIGLEKGVDLV